MHHTLAPTIDEKTHDCIEECSDCHDVCESTLQYCLDHGGPHAARDHVRAMRDCAQACDVARDFMLRTSPLHPSACGMCADACDRCAESCEQFGDDEQMRACAEECRRCAQSCREMASAGS